MRIPELAPDEVHVWLLDLPEAATDEAHALLARLRSQLSVDERARADKFVIEPARVQFVVARCALRQLLAGYCAATPSEIGFDKGPRGKPSARGQSIRFNVSHSGQVALIAVSRNLELGVDVEQVWDRQDPYALADRYFSPTELSALDAVAVDQRSEAFFWIWTRKEAYIKARGDGLYLALDSFDVTCGRDPAPRLLASRSHPADVDRFSMFNIDVAAEYPASLLVESVLRTNPGAHPGKPPKLCVHKLAPGLL